MEIASIALVAFGVIAYAVITWLKRSAEEDEVEDAPNVIRLVPPTASDDEVLTVPIIDEKPPF
jgi:hypothetical protein